MHDYFVQTQSLSETHLRILAQTRSSVSCRSITSICYEHVDSYILLKNGSGEGTGACELDKYVLEETRMELV